MTIHGIDVSFYDHKEGGIDWSKAKDSIDFVFIKCFEYQEDVAFKAQWANSRGILPRGAYYFWRQIQDETARKKTTDAFFKTIDDYDGELPVVLDLEDANANRTTAFKQIDTLSELIKRETGRYPIIYSNLSYWKEIGGEKVSKAWADAHPFWLSYPAYDKSLYFDNYYNAVLNDKRVVFVPYIPKPYTKVDFIQWTFRGKPEDVRGYPLGKNAKKAIDFNIYLGEDFSKICKGVPESNETKVYTLEEKVSILWEKYLKENSL